MEPEERPNILVVDDVDYNIAYIEGIIKHLEINIIKAFSGKEALMKISGKKLALALIDIHMPEMSGIELATIIHGDKTRDIVPIIFVTAYHHDELSLEKCYDSGIVDFILKPFRKNILFSKIKIFLELDQQKQRILDSENMYRLLLNSSPEGIIIMDIEGRIKEISNITFEIFGIAEKQDFIGKNIMDLFPNDEQERIQEVIKKTLNDGLAQNEEFILHKANQTEFMSEISLTLIRDNNGIPNAFMAIIRDISERTKMEQQLIHTERMAGIGVMAAGMAHEINQPLNTISLSMDNLIFSMNTGSPDKTYLKNKTTKIFDNITRIRNIIDHVRAFSKDHDDYIQSSFNINESIRNAKSMISEQFMHKGILLALILDGTLPNLVGNIYKFEQVIVNLVINAKDAIEEKENILNKDFAKVVEICSSREDQHVCVEIKDNGIGIESKDIDKIMLPFYSTKKEGVGTGLGLSISFGIIRDMKGTIEIQSERMKGTTIRIMIPVKKELTKQSEKK